MARRKKGLGDTIEAITEATGIKAMVEMFSEATGIDCGCDERKEKLNKLFPYRKANCLTQNEHEVLSAYKDKIPTSITPLEQMTLNRIYNRVFNDKVEFTTCGSCLKDRVIKLMQVYKTYDESK